MLKIQDSTTPHDSVVAYWHFTRDARLGSDALASVLGQVLEKRATIPEEVYSYYRQTDNGLQMPNFEQLTNMLRASIVGFQNVYLLFNNIDCCTSTGGERFRLLVALKTIVGWKQPNIHLLFTSDIDEQQIRDVQDHFDGMDPEGDGFGLKEEIGGEERPLTRGKYITNKLKEAPFRDWSSAMKAYTMLHLLHPALTYVPFYLARLHRIEHTDMAQAR